MKWFTRWWFVCLSKRFDWFQCLGWNTFSIPAHIWKQKNQLFQWLQKVLAKKCIIQNAFAAVTSLKECAKIQPANYVRLRRSEGCLTFLQAKHSPFAPPHCVFAMKWMHISQWCRMKIIHQAVSKIASLISAQDMQSICHHYLVGKEAVNDMTETHEKVIEMNSDDYVSTFLQKMIQNKTSQLSQITNQPLI